MMTDLEKKKALLRSYGIPYEETTITQENWTEFSCNGYVWREGDHVVELLDQPPGTILSPGYTVTYIFSPSGRFKVVNILT